MSPNFFHFLLCLSFVVYRISKNDLTIQAVSGANRIFYLSVPQEALLDVATSLADNAQAQRGWNRIIIEKPFGFDALSSYQLTQSLLAKFEETQIYRCIYIIWLPSFLIFLISSLLHCHLCWVLYFLPLLLW